MRLLFVRPVFVVLLGLFLAPMPAQADGELRRFQGEDSRPDPGEPELLELEERLLLARQKLDQAAREEAAQAVGRGAAVDPSAEAADAALPAEGESEKANGDEVAPEAKREPKARARPGCMYRDTTLIWEKVPGTCKR